MAKIPFLRNINKKEIGNDKFCLLTKELEKYVCENHKMLCCFSKTIQTKYEGDKIKTLYIYIYIKQEEYIFFYYG